MINKSKIPYYHFISLKVIFGRLRSCAKLSSAISLGPVLFCNHFNWWKCGFCSFRIGRWIRSVSNIQLDNKFKTTNIICRWNHRGRIVCGWNRTQFETSTIPLKSHIINFLIVSSSNWPCQLNIFLWYANEWQKTTPTYRPVGARSSGWAMATPDRSVNRILTRA